MVEALSHFLVRRRLMLTIITIAFSALMLVGGKNLYFETDYRIFFPDNYPQMIAHDDMEDAYTKSDNLAILITPPDGSVFTKDYLKTILAITEHGWQLPFSIRVDSLSNFQHTYANGDEMIVEDLIPAESPLDETDLKRIKTIALSEKRIVNNLLSQDGVSSMVSIRLELPPAVDREADKATQAEQRDKRDASFVTVMQSAHALKTNILKNHPDYDIHFMGIPAINQAFNDSSQRDMSTLIPLMYIVIIVLLFIMFRSLSAVVSIVAIIGLGTAAAMGITGWLGIPINQVNVSAPVIILTIAVCDGVHLLAIYLRDLRAGHSKVDAMTHSLKVNIQPIFLTSLTTVIGFLSLRFSESPPFQELGVMCAVGVTLAMLYTFTLMPFIAMLLGKTPEADKIKTTEPFSGLANFVIKHRTLVFWCSLIVALGLISQAGRNQINDDSITYFEPGNPLRDAADAIEANVTGVQNIAYDLRCGEANCINNPKFLAKVEAFNHWFEQLPETRHVESYVDVISNLNRNMNGGDPEFEKIPESQQLAAQYQLLYEMSLPYGLDLNNQVNFDKSGLRVSVNLICRDSERLIEIDQQAQDWLKANHPELHTTGTSVSLMFAHIGSRNIKSMISGSLIALLGVTITLLIALRSFRFGLMSLIPNAFPAAITLGIWGLVVGQVNVAVAVVFSVTLGIVVDDTVHFLSKYLRARRVEGLSPEDAIRYAFNTVGGALLITTVVLSIGFGLLLLSDFNVNAYMGTMTAMTILIAVVFDFLFLPALLLLIDRKETLN